jgi:hypothetical protein
MKDLLSLPGVEALRHHEPGPAIAVGQYLPLILLLQRYAREQYMCVRDVCLFLRVFRTAL